MARGDSNASPTPYDVRSAARRPSNPRPARPCRLPRCPWATREGRARKGRGAGRGGGRSIGRGAGLGLRGPGSARPPRHAITAAAAVFAQLALRWGRNWAAQWHLARAVGKRFWECRAKRLYVYYTVKFLQASRPYARPHSLRLCPLQPYRVLVGFVARWPQRGRENANS